MNMITTTITPPINPHDCDYDYDYTKTCNRLQSITIIIIINPNPTGHHLLVNFLLMSFKTHIANLLTHYIAAEGR